MRRFHTLVFLVIVLSSVFALTACNGSPSDSVENANPVPPLAMGVRATTASSNPIATVAPTRRAATATRVSVVNGFKTIARAELPPEAIETLTRIQRGGPFPYRQDGQVFQNREGILPKKQSGYYHEYTVETPGSNDRGARRIVTGANDEYYYTSDHYASFRIILDP
jgi:ribonuclease T1